MFCESWREALSDAALRGEELPHEAQAHLNGCASCHGALFEEQRLLASIDGGLRAAANAEVPASLVPRVRAAVAGRSSASIWRLPAWAFASTALLLVAVVAYQWKRSSHPVMPRQPVATVNAETPFSPKPSSDAGRKVVAPNSAPSPHTAAVRPVVLRREPEVLVTSEEQVNLLRYLNRVQARNVNHATLVITDDEQIKPLEIARIQWPTLTVEPLESGGSR